MSKFKISKKMKLLAFTLVLAFVQIVRAQEVICIDQTPKAGSPQDSYKKYDDQASLNQILSKETRMQGFQICTDTEQKFLTQFKIVIADDFGKADEQVLEGVGPGTENCRRFALADPLTDKINAMNIYL